jgi:hypothetical protein
MIDWEVDRIRREAEDALAITTAEITELALEEIPREPRAEAPESDDGPSTSEAKVAAYEIRARGFLSGKEGAPERPIPVRAVPSYFIAPDEVRLWRPASLDPVKEASLLVSSTAVADGLELELRTLGEVSGSYRLYARQSESASLLRRVFRSRAMSEGWSSWHLTRVLDRGYGSASNDNQLKLRQLHHVRLDLLRLIAVLGLHAMDMSLAEAERRFRDQGGLPRDVASQEALRAAVDPGAGSGALGRILVSALARDFTRANPSVLESPEVLDRSLLGEGLLPLRLVRFELLGAAE